MRLWMWRVELLWLLWWGRVLLHQVWHRQHILLLLTHLHLISEWSLLLSSFSVIKIKLQVHHLVHYLLGVLIREVLLLAFCLLIHVILYVITHKVPTCKVLFLRRWSLLHLLFVLWRLLNLGIDVRETLIRVLWLFLLLLGDRIRKMIRSEASLLRSFMRYCQSLAA